MISILKVWSIGENWISLLVNNFVISLAPLSLNFLHILHAVIHKLISGTMNIDVSYCLQSFGQNPCQRIVKIFMLWLFFGFSRSPFNFNWIQAVSVRVSSGQNRIEISEYCDDQRRVKKLCTVSESSNIFIYLLQSKSGKF